MAVALGKRKRRDDVDTRRSSSEDDDDMRARFQRAFEAKFQPLQPSKQSLPIEHLDDAEDTEDDQEDVEDSVWEGLSDDEVDVEVIEHRNAGKAGDMALQEEKRKFMSSRPPDSSAEQLRVPSRKRPDSPGEDNTEASNLKHDMALQRLLKESHLLDPKTFATSSTAPEGKAKLKALDLRLQDLGAKKSITHQDKMPFARRRGMLAKATSREQKRRKEAAENGIVLEKAVSAPTKAQQRRRERSVGGPTLGKFRSGTLRLSSRDLRAIEGPKQKGFGGRKGGR